MEWLWPGGGRIRIEALDIAVILVYFVFIVGIGLWAGRKKRAHLDSDTYFRAGGTLTWAVIGMALFSTNISTIHMVGFAGEGYRTGLTFGNYEWMAPFLLIVLALFFAPFYLRSRIATLPDFLEKRYCGACRNWLAALSIVSAVFIHIGFTLYTGALVIKTLFGIPIMTSIVVAAVLTGVYTVVGGLLAVVVTGALQTAILLAGSMILTFVAMTKIGGWEGLKEHVEPAKLTILRPASDPAGLPWYSVFLGYPVIGLWYWCADQTIVQRVLGAKDANHARVGPLFAGFLKILPVFIFFLPGTVYLALVNRGDFPPLSKPDECFSMAIKDLLPPGVTGLMAAALLAALMSTVSGALNSIATLVSFDLYKQWRPEASDRKLVLVGRIATIVCMIVAIVWSKYVGQFASVYKGCVDLICYIAPPITAVFVFGVFWRRASDRAAVWTLAVGSLMGFGVFVLDWYDLFGWDMPAMLATFYLCCICSLLMVVLSLVRPHKHTEESVKLVWNNPLDALKEKGWPFLANYKFLSFALFVTMVACYVSLLKPEAVPAVDPGPAEPGLVCTVYDNYAVSTRDGAERRPIENFHQILFAQPKPVPVKSWIVKDLNGLKDFNRDRVYEYRGYIDIPADGQYQFNLNSAQKLEIRIGKVTLSLYDRTLQVGGEARGFSRTYIGQIHLKKGKHEFLLYYYPAQPWVPFELRNELGDPNERELARKAAWEKTACTFKLTYQNLKGGKAEPIPAALFCHETR